MDLREREVPYKIFTVAHTKQLAKAVSIAFVIDLGLVCIYLGLLHNASAKIVAKTRTVEAVFKYQSKMYPTVMAIVLGVVSLAFASVAAWVLFALVYANNRYNTYLLETNQIKYKTKFKLTHTQKEVLRYLDGAPLESLDLSTEEMELVLKLAHKIEGERGDNYHDYTREYTTLDKD